MKRWVTLQNKARMIAPLLLCLVFMLPLARPSWTQETGRSTTGKLIEATIPVPALKGNKLGDAAEQPVAVYLPPSYETSHRSATRRSTCCTDLAARLSIGRAMAIRG